MLFFHYTCIKTTLDEENTLRQALADLTTEATNVKKEINSNISSNTELQNMLNAADVLERNTELIKNKQLLGSKTTAKDLIEKDITSVTTQKNEKVDEINAVDREIAEEEDEIDAANAELATLIQNQKDNELLKKEIEQDKANNAILEEVAAFEVEKTTEETKSDVLNNEITAIDGEITDLEDAKTALETELDTKQTNVQTLTNEINALNTFNETANTHLSIEGTVYPVDIDGTEYSTEGDLQAQVNTNDGEIKSKTEAKETADGEIATIQASIQTNGQETQAKENEKTSKTDEKNTVDGNIAAIVQEIANAKGKLVPNDSVTEVSQADLDAKTTRYNDEKTRIIKGTAAEHEKIETAQNVIKGKEALKDYLESIVSDLEETISALKIKVDEKQRKIDELTTAISNIQTEIDAYETGVKDKIEEIDSTLTTAVVDAQCEHLMNYSTLTYQIQKIQKELDTKYTYTKPSLKIRYTYSSA